MQAVDDVDLPGRPRRDGAVRRLAVAVDPDRASCVLDVEVPMDTRALAAELGVTEGHARRYVVRTLRRLARNPEARRVVTELLGWLGDHRG